MTLDRARPSVLVTRPPGITGALLPTAAAEVSLLGEGDMFIRGRM